MISVAHIQKVTTTFFFPNYFLSKIMGISPPQNHADALKIIMEFTKPRRRGQRQLKNEFIFYL